MDDPLASDLVTEELHPGSSDGSDYRRFDIEEPLPAASLLRLRRERATSAVFRVTTS
jgi:hypothetical protein